jgi:hypothetical protein
MNGICYFSRYSKTILNLLHLTGATILFQLCLRRPILLFFEENGLFQFVDMPRPAKDAPADE